MAKYLMLIYETEESYANASEADFNRVMELHNAYPEQVKKLGGEILGGYYLIEAEDLDQALAIGKVTPAPYGCIEVRPIMVFG